jgi:hypothetical protein
MVWDEKRGWNEDSPPADVTSVVEVIPAKTGHAILIRRIRGSASGAVTLSKYDGSSDTTLEVLPSGAIDIPGLELQTDVGDSVRALGAGVTDADGLKIQYAYKLIHKQVVR